MNSDLVFNSAEELYQKVLPVLRSKKEELIKNHIIYVTEKDIWNYLAKSYWRSKKGLEFYELVDSIINLDMEMMDKYLIDRVKVDTTLEDNNI